MVYDVFISYQSNDHDLANELHRRLSQERFVVWFDTTRLVPGCNWHAEIEAGCEASRVVLPVLTPRWKTSVWTRFETYGAEAVLPILYEGDWSTVATPPLYRYQALAINLQQSGDASWIRLFESLRTLLAKPAPNKIERIAHLRYSANPYFVGREAELNRIHESLHPGPSASLTQGAVHAVLGMGGFGKTTLVRQYAEKFWRLYPQILWVDGRTNVESGFAQLAESLSPGLQIIEESERARHVLRILNERTERLLILDDVQDEESIHQWIPRAGGCRTLITSRFASFSAAIQTFHIYVLEPEPSRQLLLDRAGRVSTPLNQDDCDRLGELLGYLPLALEQAAAYIRQRGEEFGFSDYIELYRRATKTLLAKGVLGSTQYPDSVITTWNASVERLSALGRTILTLASFLAPEPIPIQMFIQFGDLLQVFPNYTGNLLTAKPSAAPPDVYILDALEELTRYSLVQQYGHHFGVHILLQTVERLNVPSDQAAEWLETAILILLGYAPERSEDLSVRETWRVIEPHAMHLAGYAATQSGIENEGRLLLQLGKYLMARASYPQAEPILRRLVMLPELHGQSRVAALSTLGVLLTNTNKLSEAARVLKEALSLDYSHSGVLNNLAYAFKLSGDLEEADRLYERSLRIYEEKQELDDGYATVLANRAKVLSDLHRLDDAEVLVRRAIPILERECGVRHPRTAIVRSELADLIFTRAFGKAVRDHKQSKEVEGGEYRTRVAEAEALYRGTLDVVKEAYPEGHPTVATAMAGLGHLLNMTGDLERLLEAASLYREAIGINEKLLGTEHPKTQSARGELAQIESDINATTEVAREAQRMIARAQAMVTGGDRSGAERQFREILKTLNEAGLFKSQLTAATLHELALLISDKGVEGENLMLQAIEIDRMIYGAKHPEVGTDWANLAKIFFKQGRFKDAETPLRKALEIAKGPPPSQPEVILRRTRDLALVVGKIGRIDEAQQLYHEALDLAVGLFGKESTQVRSVVEALSHLPKS